MGYDDNMRKDERGASVQAMPMEDFQPLNTPLTITDEIIIEMDGVAEIKIIRKDDTTYNKISNELRHYGVTINIKSVEVLSGNVTIA